MLSCSTGDYKALPKEYRKAAEALFPPVQNAGPENNPNLPSQPAILGFADKLGVGTDYRKLDTGWKNTEELESFLLSFRNNLDLLIQKTWVEKADEDRKEKLLDRVPGFIDIIKKGDFTKALGEFGTILEELAWLLFGSQSHKEDFFDYAFRIDHQLGLFWWYGGQLGHLLSLGTGDEKILKAILLLGLCYLTDF
ncbi:MAG: hypothetical protein FWG29_04260 [Treponema sp.]|nr:hypothetical protein [Treponema sp.]